MDDQKGRLPLLSSGSHCGRVQVLQATVNVNTEVESPFFSRQQPLESAQGQGSS